MTNDDGKRVFWLTAQGEPRPLGAVGSGAWCVPGMGVN